MRVLCCLVLLFTGRSFALLNQDVLIGEATTNWLEILQNLVQAVNGLTSFLNESQCCQQKETQLPKSCKDIQESGETQSGVYIVYVGSRAIQVYCDMVTDGGGWLVIQRREDGSRNFKLDWNSYADGFGSLNDEFWLGNRNIHQLTSDQAFVLRVDMRDGNGDERYAQYETFQVGSEAEQFKLFLNSYTGDAGDSMSGHSGMNFSTVDEDNDTWQANCADKFNGGWWYSKCHSANPNGLYLNGPHTSYADGIEWKAWKGYYYSLQFIEMKIRPLF